MSEHEAADDALAGKIILRTFLVAVVLGVISIAAWLF